MNENTASVLRTALWLFFAAFFLWLMNSCATTRPEPPEPLLATTARLRPDSLPAPNVQFRRPNYAQSLPTAYPQVPVPERSGGGLLGRLIGAKNGTPPRKQKTGKVKYTGPVTIVQQTGQGNVATPATVTKPAAAVMPGNGNQAPDYFKADLRDQHKQKPSLDQSTRQGLASGHVVAGIVVVLVIVAGLLWLFFWGKK